MEEANAYQIRIPDNWPSNNIYSIEIADKKLCISKVDNDYYAYSALCPHGGVHFSDGGVLIKNCVIVCPLHNYKFDVKNGRNISNEGYKLKTFSVNVVDKHLEIIL